VTRAFISYSRTDASFADRLAAALPGVGVEPWIDRAGIHGGAKWSSAIQQALDAADVLILVLSPAAMASSNVEDEWQYALDHSKPVLPVLLEPTEVHFQLGRIQYTDFLGQPFEAALAQLVESVRRALVAASDRDAADAPDDDDRKRAAHAAAAVGPPTGTVTFLFTDVEGSTERWESHPEAMTFALERHDALMRSAVAAQFGYGFKAVGDAFCAAFARAGDALAAAVSAQRAIAAEDWGAFGEGFEPLAVRMGLHTGEATERDGDYFGPHVNRVARLEAAAHGGQLLLSEATQLVVRVALPEGCDLRDWGQHRLKDLRHSEHIYQLVGPGLPEVDTPPTTAEALAPRERVRVVEVEGDRGATIDPDSVWARLQAAITADEGEAVTLTPAEATRLARHKPTDWREHRLGRIAEWSQPRYRLDGRFVGLTLLIDQGEEAVQGRWQAAEERYEDLGELLGAIADPAIVVLGPPGGGKSTLLRRLELDAAIAGLRWDDEVGNRVTFFLSLNTYKFARPGDPLPLPGEWLATQWHARNPDLPALDDLLAKGCVTLLLDALNEMPAASERDFRERVQLWKDWLQNLVVAHPGNRIVFSCRSLDYSQSLSTPGLRVPQVRIEPLTNDQVRDFLVFYSPGRWREIWQALEGSPQLEVLRSPYFLVLLVEQVEAAGEMPAGRAALFTGFVRQALRRELERGSPVFESDALLASRDRRQVSRWRWKGAYDLPERGLLLPRLAVLAQAMQLDRADGERSQVRIDLDDALDLLDSDEDEAIVAAGEALSVLDEDDAAGELMYIHQLVQEYFAARELARAPDPELVRTEWRSAKIRPSVEEVVGALDPADALPGLPQTGWEETTLLSAAMANDPAGFVRGVMVTNLALAGRIAAQPELLPLLPAELLDDLRWALVQRCRDVEADLRDRIACGYAVGDLGDPRFERTVGPHGEYLRPPLVEIPGGIYSIGDDESIEWEMPGGNGVTSAHIPRHAVEVPDFAIGQYLVTNAEWRCFMESGGYEDERWWDTPDAKRWRIGELANEAAKWNNQQFRKRFLADPDLFEQIVDEGRFASSEAVERWRSWMELDDKGFEAALDTHWQAKRESEPAFWHDARLNHPAQPVVGVCWYEARAYCNWLSAQTGSGVRLPTEVEWEVSAGGVEGRRYPWGDGEGRTLANTIETRIKRTTPVGAFPEGDSPDALADLGGNAFEWTTSLFGEIDDEDIEATDFPYPYDLTDGREDPEAGSAVRRVVRGGGWNDDLALARAAYRSSSQPDDRHNAYGLRVVVVPSPVLYR
jgi:formylglycine-generating enzyme required for sulfatase activity/class 3 adenylate cyclase